MKTVLKMLYLFREKKNNEQKDLFMSFQFIFFLSNQRLTQIDFYSVFFSFQEITTCYNVFYGIWYPLMSRIYRNEMKSKRA